MFEYKHFGNILDGTAGFPADTLPHFVEILECKNTKQNILRQEEVIELEIYHQLFQDS